MDRPSPSLRDTRTLVAHLRDAILALITDGQRQPGDRIPTEAELTARFGVSRPALREALKLLEQEGAIRVEHGRGRFLAAGHPPLSQAITHFESVTELMRSFGYEPENRVLAVAEQPAEPEVAGALHIAPGHPVIRLERLRCHAGGR